MLIEEKAYRMHQNVAQPLVAQMPQITHSDSFHLTTISQLTKDRVDEVTNPSQNRTLVRYGFGQMCFAERRLQHNAFRPQKGLQIGKLIVAITQDDTRCTFQQDGRDFSIGFMRWSQEHACEQTRPTQLRMHPKAIKRLPIRMIFARARHPSEAHTPGCSSKTAHRKWHTVHDGQAWIIADQFIAQTAPQALFDRPQIGGLPDKDRAMHLPELRKEVTPMPTEVLEESLLLAFSQVASHDFHRDDLTIRQGWLGTSFSHPFVSCDAGQHLVNQTKTCNTEIVQAHGFPPHEIAIHSEHNP